jgi:hypothetical protein
LTAEIAILNRNAVAMAADSAVTIDHPAGHKIYNTVNKLFALSKYRPVGIMVYGAADFMRTPWETIIKAFRSRLGPKDFPTLQGYASSFLKFVERNEALFPTGIQTEWAFRCLRIGLQDLRKAIDAGVEEAITRNKSVDHRAILRIVRMATKAFRDVLKRTNHLPSFNKRDIARFIKLYRSAINDSISDVFETLPMASLQIELRHICALILTKQYRSFDHSGIVIAGFGEKDLFPRLVSYECDCIIGGKLRHLQTRKVTVRTYPENSLRASIIPFAQREMVNRFMEGIDPSYRRQLDGYLSTLLREGYPERVARSLKRRVGDKAAVRIQKHLRTLGRKLLKDLSAGLHQYQRKQFIEPVVEMVAVLPKDELAAMAESLVNLTAFKRRVTSAEIDTVALPIDVAVISKGDGFIWIKRKHYFDKNLNPAFLANYYRN